MEVNIANIVSPAKDYSSSSTFRRLKLIYMQFVRFLMSNSENKLCTQIQFFNYCHKQSLQVAAVNLFMALVLHFFSKLEAVVALAIYQGSTR